MKFVDFVLFAMVLNLMFAGVDAMDLDFRHKNIETTTTNYMSQYSDERIDADGVFCPNANTSFTCQVIDYGGRIKLADNDVKGEGSTTSDNDFLRGIGMTKQILGNGLFLPGNTIDRFFGDIGCNSNECKANEKLIALKWIINGLMWIMYIIAVIQMLSGRSMENNL